MTPMAQVRLLPRRIPEGRSLWLFAGHVGPLVGHAAAGDLVDVLTADGQFYGRGLYNPASKIRVRILTFEDRPIDETFWRGRIQQAIRLRQRVVSQSNAYRLIYAEGDRLPGLIVDRYDQLLVMQCLSFGIDNRKELLADILLKELKVTAVYMRNEAKSRQLEGLPL